MTEDRIIAGCKKGKIKAQKCLVDQYSPALFSLCKRYFKNDADAYDALQESLISIFKNISKYQTTGSFKGWLSRITINASLKLLRKKSSWNEVEIETHVFNISESPIGLNNLIYQELLIEIRKLPSIYSAVFNLYVIDGYAHNEIAEILDIQESSSRSRLARAKKMLRINIKKNEWIALAR